MSLLNFRDVRLPNINEEDKRYKNGINTILRNFFLDIYYSFTVSQHHLVKGDVMNLPSEATTIENGDMLITVAEVRLEDQYEYIKKEKW